MQNEQREADAEVVQKWVTTAIEALSLAANPPVGGYSTDPRRMLREVRTILGREAVAAVTEALERLAAPSEVSVLVGQVEYVHAAGLLLAEMERAHPSGEFLANRTTNVIRALVDGSAAAFAGEKA